MWQAKKMCLSCRYYRLQDEMSGICRVEKGAVKDYPLKLNEDVCEKYSDCGQQYYIRKGWIQGRRNIDKEGGRSQN